MKQLLTTLTVMLTLSINAQPYLGLGANNKGVNMQIGTYLWDYTITLSHNAKPFDRKVPHVTALMIGQDLMLDQNRPDDWYTLHIAIGGSLYRGVKFDSHQSEDPIELKGFSAIARVELGRDVHIGRFTAAVEYSYHFSYGLGFKVFPFR